MKFRVWWVRYIGAITLIFSMSNCDNKSSNIANFPPEPPTNPSPFSGEQRIEVDTRLSWDCSDPDGDNLTYDVYFGVTHDPPLASSNHTDNFFDVEELDHNSHFYWKIVARDNRNYPTEGPLWSFSTKREAGLYAIGTCQFYPSTDFIYNIFVSGDFLYMVYDIIGLGIIDVSDPHRPYYASTYNIPSVIDIVIRDNYAYLAADDSGLVILDVSDPHNPQNIGKCSNIDGADDIVVLENKAYIASLEGLFIFNISDPFNPTIMGSIEELVRCHTLEVNGNYAYILQANFEYETVYIADIANPDAPFLVDSTFIDGFSFSMEIIEDYLYIANIYGAINIVDISDPYNSYLASTFALESPLIDIYLVNDIVFAANYSQGLKAFDISIRLDPIEIAEFSTQGNAINVFWENERVYLIDWPPRLFILEYEP